jgi:putative ABC transport system ATP-binding protein
MLKIHNLCKVYRTSTYETRALHNLNIEITKGEFVAIMGPSGCGKSTLLNILGMLDHATDGSYIINSIDITQTDHKNLSNIRKNNIGFIFQSFNLIEELTVEENIEMALLYHNIPNNIRKERVKKVMDSMNISHRRLHLPSQLSGGQQQKVAIARAIVSEPLIILADEPTGNLDSIHGQEVMQLLQKLNQKGTTVIMVTHSEAHADYAQRTINLFDGQVVSQSMRKPAAQTKH